MIKEALRYMLSKVEKRDLDINQWKEVYNSENGYDLVSDKSFKDSDYFKCIRIIANNIAKVPLVIKQTTEAGERIAIEHPLYYTLKTRPNPYMSAIDFFKAMHSTKEHNGESAALIVRDKNYIVTGLYPIIIDKIIIDDVGLLKSKKIVSPI
ncbi:MAG: phage portal protein, partial [Clostridium sp.]